MNIQAAIKLQLRLTPLLTLRAPILENKTRLGRVSLPQRIFPIRTTRVSITTLRFQILQAMKIKITDKTIRQNLHKMIVEKNLKGERLPNQENDHTRQMWENRSLHDSTGVAPNGEAPFLPWNRTAEVSPESHRRGWKGAVLESHQGERGAARGGSSCGRNL